MSIFDIFSKKNDFKDYIFDKKTYSALSLAQFTSAFPEYSDFEEEKNIKIQDSILPIVLIGYDSVRNNTHKDKKKLTDLTTEIKKLFHKGTDLLFQDYITFITEKSVTSEDLTKYSAYWLSKNLQLYLSGDLKIKIEEKRFLDIFSIFLKTSYNDEKFNYHNFISENFTGNMKTQEGMLEFVALTENFAKNLFISMKGVV